MGLGGCLGLDGDTSLKETGWAWISMSSGHFAARLLEAGLYCSGRPPPDDDLVAATPRTTTSRGFPPVAIRPTYRLLPQIPQPSVRIRIGNTRISPIIDLRTDQPTRIPTLLDSVHHMSRHPTLQTLNISIKGVRVYQPYHHSCTVPYAMKTTASPTTHSPTLWF